MILRTESVNKNKLWNPTATTASSKKQQKKTGKRKKCRHLDSLHYDRRRRQFKRTNRTNQNIKSKNISVVTAAQRKHLASFIWYPPWTHDFDSFSALLSIGIVHAVCVADAFDIFRINTNIHPELQKETAHQLHDSARFGCSHLQRTYTTAAIASFVPIIFEFFAVLFPGFSVHKT